MDEDWLIEQLAQRYHIEREISEDEIERRLKEKNLVCAVWPDNT